MRTRSALALVAVIVCGGALASASPAAAVGCAAFKAAVESANSGDVITLDAGLTCHEKYVLPANKTPFVVTIQGGGAGATLDGNGLGTTILTGNPQGGNQMIATVRNLTFRNGTGALDDPGAIKFGAINTTVTLDRDHFLNNTGGQGGAVEVQSIGGPRPIEISNSTFGDGTAAGAHHASRGGGLFVLSGIGGPPVVLTHNTFDRNDATEDAGALLVGSADLVRTT